MFIYFPAWDWTQIIVGNEYTAVGNPPSISVPESFRKTVVYWSGNPENKIPRDLYARLTKNGIRFCNIQEMNLDVGSLGPFSTDNLFGIYHEDPNCYDGLADYTIARVKGFTVYSDHTGGTIDISNIQKRETGLYYPGWFVALSKLGSDNEF
jgi:hypothetical protein